MGYTGGNSLAGEMAKDREARERRGKDVPKAHEKKKEMAKKTVGMKDISGGKDNANKMADSQARTKAVAS